MVKVSVTYIYTVMYNFSTFAAPEKFKNVVTENGVIWYYMVTGNY